MKVSPTQLLAALARRRVGEFASGRREPAAGSGPPAVPASSTAAGEVLRRRIATIDPADPDRARRAARCFFESVLLAELGGDLANDPAFQNLVDQVHAALLADPDTAKKLDRAGRQLLGES